MIRIEDECVGCSPEIGCYGEVCPLRNVEHYFCDHCCEEIEGADVYTVDDEDLCEDCLKEMFRKEW